jgi:hypothetical protein
MKRSLAALVLALICLSPIAAHAGGVTGTGGPLKGSMMTYAASSAHTLPGFEGADKAA